ncbi:MAG: hypothetical protein M3422_08555 [Actinomycetota bacterium]|nr:hypothetical protein [Actinomycetota bacterium]
MGAKDWMIVYADGDVRPVLRKAAEPDRAATRALVERLYPGATPIEDGTLDSDANPKDGEVYAGWFDGVTIVCTGEVAVDAPSRVDPRFLAEAGGRTTYVHAMHSVVDWGSFAVWSSDGTLRRALSLWPESGIVENVGAPFDFEAPFWAGERPVDDEYALPFHPLELAEAALREFFGFNYEGEYLDDDPELEDIILLGFAVEPR